MYGQNAPVCSPPQQVPTFFYNWDVGTITINTISLVRLNPASSTDITAEMTAGGFAKVKRNTKDVMYYPASAALTTSFDPGEYYLLINTSAGNLYSEVFKMCDKVSDKLLVEYWHNEAFDLDDSDSPIQIPYDGTGFKNKLYLETQLGKPQYNYFDQATDREGVSFPLTRGVSKTFQFEFYAAEYFIDALRLIRLHTNVEVTSLEGIKYNAYDFLMSPEWTERGDIAVIECNFTNNEVIRKTAITT